MPRLIILVVVVAGLAFAASRFSGEVDTSLPAPEASVDETTDEPPAEADGTEAAETEPAAGPSRAVRDVSPEGVFSGPVAPSRPPERVMAPEPEPEAQPTKRYFRVVVEDAGTLRAGRRTIRLAGIEAPAADATCTDEAGTEWPCGRAARAQLNLFLRGRAIDCATVSEGNEAITATCRTGGEDIAAWLVDQGWARAGEESRYSDAARAARSDGRGLFQREWRSAGDRTAGAAEP